MAIAAAATRMLEITSAMFSNYLIMRRSLVHERRSQKNTDGGEKINMHFLAFENEQTIYMLSAILRVKGLDQTD